MTYEMDCSVLHCYDHHNDVSSRIGLGRKAALGDFLPFYSTSHHYGFSRRSYTPSSDRNTFVHLRKKATRGRVSSIACGARANKKNIFGCDFPQFHPARRFGSPVPVTSPLEVIFCYCFWVVVRTGEEPIEGLLGEKRFGFVLLWRGLLG